MNTTELDYFAVVFFLQKTKGKSVLKQSVLDYIKSFINSFELIRKSKVTMKERSIDVDGEGFGANFDSSGTFKMAFYADRESAFETANTIANDVCKKLNEGNLLEAISKVIVVSLLAYKIDEKCDLFVKFLAKDALEGLSKTGEDFVPKRLDCDTSNKERFEQFSVRRLSKGNMIETTLMYKCQDQLPLDVSMKAVKEHEELRRRLLARLIGEK